MDEERDVEVFERIPWESLEDKGDRRWMAYLLAGVIVLGAVGVSLGRQMRPGVAPPSTIDTQAATTTFPAPGAARPTTVEALTAPVPATTWSEADLMALPVESVEMGALAVAEWYVVDYFTRDDPEEDRSFVEWARATGVEWESPSSVWVTVLVRRLAAPADQPYQRMPAEAWRVGMDLGDGGWSVIPGPVAGEAPELAMGSGDGGETTEWTDPAGLAWQVRDLPGGGR